MRGSELSIFAFRHLIVGEHKLIFAEEGERAKGKRGGEREGRREGGEERGRRETYQPLDGRKGLWSEASVVHPHQSCNTISAKKKEKEKEKEK